MKIRGEHLSEDFAAGVASQADEVRAAVTSLINSLAGQLPNAGNAAFVATATQTTATGLASAIRPAVSSGSGDVNIENLNIHGVWDMTDPLATRKIAAQVSKAVDDFKKGYK